MGNLAQLKDEVMDELGVKGEHRTLLGFLIKTKNDIRDFLEVFNGNVIHSIFSFQVYKRKNNPITLDQFLDNVLQNKKKALEDLFQEPVKRIHLDLIHELNITYEEIFARYLDQINRSFLNILNNWNVRTEEESDSFLLYL